MNCLYALKRVSVYVILSTLVVLLNASHAKAQSHNQLIVYSNQSVPDSKGKEVINQAYEFWDLFVTSKTLEKNQISEDRKFEATLNQELGVPFLKITELSTRQEYFHFLNSTPSQAEFQHGYLATPDDLLSFNKTDFERMAEISGEKNLLEKSQAWDEQSLKVQSEVEMLYQGLLKKWKKVEQENPNITKKEIIEKFVERAAIFYVDPVFGQAELNAVDGELFIRVVHKGTELSFLITQKNTINYESKHFKQYLARQHIVAGTGRKDGQFGRDVIVLEAESFEASIRSDLQDPHRYREFSRATKFSGKWWGEYWNAIKKAPDLSSFLFGVTIGGSLQFMTAMVSTQIMTWMGLPVHNGEIIAATAFVYGATLGTFISTYKNWERLGPHSNQVWKNLANSLLFRYILTFTIGGNALHSLSLLTIDGFLNNLRIWVASRLNNQSKVHWYNFATIRERAGLSRGKFKITKKIEWSRSSLEYQVFYLPNFFFSIVERINFGQPQSNPVGMSVFLLQIPLAERAALWWFKRVYDKTGHPEAKLMYEKAQLAWDQKVRFWTDPEVPNLLTQKYFPSFSQSGLARKSAANNRLAEKFSESYSVMDLMTESQAREQRWRLLKDTSSFDLVFLVNLPLVVAQKMKIEDKQLQALKTLSQKYPALYQMPKEPAVHYIVPGLTNTKKVVLCEKIF